MHAGLQLDATFTVGSGDRVVLFGPSGAGKTTLLRLIAGLLRPDEGRVSLETVVLVDRGRGVDVPLRRRRIGMIFQDDRLFPHRDVTGNVGYGLRGWSQSERGRRVEEMAAACGIGGLMNRPIGSLSGGERQRVGLARALAPRPRLLLCDEPVSALDRSARAELVERLLAIQGREGFPMISVTHEATEAMALGRRLLRIEGGRVADAGPPLEALAGSAGLENVWRGEVVAESLVKLEGGLLLQVAGLLAIGEMVGVRVAAADVLLARGPMPPVSARNVFEGRVGRVIVGRDGAEVVVQLGALACLASVTIEAVGTLGLAEGMPIWAIIKARACRAAPPPGGDCLRRV